MLSLVKCGMKNVERCCGWNMTKNYLFLYTFSRELTYKPGPSTDFHAWWFEWCELMQGCAFWGFAILLPILGVQYPQNPIFGVWIGVFKPNVQNIESFMLSKLLHRFQPNFALWVVIVGGPNHAQWIQNGRRPPFWKKNVKLPYFCNHLMDFDEIWQDDTYCPHTVDLPLKFWIMPCWKITMIAMPSQGFDRSFWNLVCWCKMDLFTAATVKKINVKIEDGRRLPFWKPLNRRIYATVWSILTKFGTVTPIGPVHRTDL